MRYKYMDAYLATPNISTQKEEYIEGFKQILDQEFSNASDVWTIEEETVFGSGVYKPIFVKVNHAIDTITGQKRGDDYKTILFKELDHVTGPGRLYRFNDNIWIAYYTESIKSLTATTAVQRCNNNLKWMDDQGGIHVHPCSMLEAVKRPADQEKSGQGGMILPEGLITITAQFNDTTNKIRPNQRFLFGNADNWICYKVRGSGIINYNNQKTNDTMSSGTLQLIVGTDFVNLDTDDIVNGIADFYKGVYSLEITNVNTVRNIGNKLQLNTTLFLDGNSIVRNLVWNSGDENIAIVDQNGLVTFIGAGSTNITCNLENNSSVSASISVTTTAAPVTEYDLAVLPDDNFVYEGSTKVFSVYLTLNGVQQSNVATFILVPNTVPSANYVYTVVDSNHFSIQNKKMFLDDVLTINVFSFSQSKNIDIRLRGSF
jgi:hypothetical protein